MTLMLRLIGFLCCLFSRSGSEPWGWPFQRWQLHVVTAHRRLFRALLMTKDTGPSITPPNHSARFPGPQTWVSPRPDRAGPEGTALEEGAGLWELGWEGWVRPDSAPSPVPPGGGTQASHIRLPLAICHQFHWPFCAISVSPDTAGLAPSQLMVTHLPFCKALPGTPPLFKPPSTPFPTSVSRCCPFLYSPQDRRRTVLQVLIFAECFIHC